jgi:hypothetical protein
MKQTKKEPQMQIDIKQPHDSIFKNVFDDIDNTKDLLKAYLPMDLVEQIDFDTMKPTFPKHLTRINQNSH